MKGIYFWTLSRTLLFEVNMKFCLKLTCNSFNSPMKPYTTAQGPLCPPSCPSCICTEFAEYMAPRWATCPRLTWKRWGHWQSAFWQIKVVCTTCAWLHAVPPCFLQKPAVAVKYPCFASFAWVLGDSHITFSDLGDQWQVEGQGW
jgi:hypothetical protein